MCFAILVVEARVLEKALYSQLQTLAWGDSQLGSFRCHVLYVAPHGGFRAADMVDQKS